MKCCSPACRTARRIPGRFPGPAHARGKWFTLDIHCHVRSAKAAEMVEGNEAVSRWFLETQASPQSQAHNRANGVRTAEQGRSPEQRIADMDLMGIDIQAISPAPRQTYYGADPDLGPRGVARRSTISSPRSAANIPTASSGSARCRSRRRSWRSPSSTALHKSLGLSRHRDHDPCRRRGSVGPRASARIFARCEELGLLVFMHSDGFTEARRFHDHYFANVIGNPLDTTVALHHLIFGGVLQDYPEPEAGRRRMAAAICRPIRGASTTSPRPGPTPATHLREMPTTYLKRLYFDALVYTHHQLEYLVEEYGVDHILVGTDYPADMGEIDPVGFIEGARASTIPSAARSSAATRRGS